MEFENYTDRLRGFIQVARSVAAEVGHQQLVPEHLLKVFVSDRQGLVVDLIKASGGDAEKLSKEVELELAKQPVVEVCGGNDIYLSTQIVRLFQQAEKVAANAGDQFVTVEQLLVAVVLTEGISAAEIFKASSNWSV